jgi:hypothetical protein
MNPESRPRTSVPVVDSPRLPRLRGLIRALLLIVLAIVAGANAGSQTSQARKTFRVGALQFEVPAGWHGFEAGDLDRARNEFAGDMGSGLRQYDRAGFPPASLDEFRIFQKPADGQVIAWSLKMPPQTVFLEVILEREKKGLVDRSGQAQQGNCRMVKIGGTDMVRTDVVLTNGARAVNIVYWTSEQPGQLTTIMLGLRPGHRPQTADEVSGILDSIKRSANR